MTKLFFRISTAALVLFAACALAMPAWAQTAAGDPEAWHAPTPEQPDVILVKNATVWTSGPQGKLENADLLIRRGKVEKVGTDLEAPKGAVVIDGTGKHVTPGLIDCHSHSFIVGGTSPLISCLVLCSQSAVFRYRRLSWNFTMLGSM